MKKLYLTAVFLMLFISSSALKAQEGNVLLGTWSGKLNVQGTQLSLVLHLDDEAPTMDSPDQGVKGIPIQVERSGAGNISINIPSLGASYKGMWLVKQIVGTFTQMNVSFPLTFIPGEDKPNRPQTPVGPFPYSTEEVSFTNGDVVLNGTLTLPEDCSRDTPALIMVTGSGIQNRDEELFEHKPFAVIADALARAGIATLRYDDRGFNGYDGNINDCTTEDFKEDAFAGIKLLRERFDKVGVIGHSEGGTIAILLASEKKADYIISLAGMVVSGAETLVWQNKVALMAAGVPEDTAEEYCSLIGAAFEAKVSGGNMPLARDFQIPERLRQNYQAVLAQIQQPYMSHFLSLDMRQVLDSVSCPVLALNGTKDTQVDAESNLGALREGLAGSPLICIESMEGLNHLFQPCETGAVGEYRTIEQTISQDVLEKIIQWIGKL